MTRDVLVTISGNRLMGADNEDVELVTPGTYSWKSGTHIVRYDEPGEGGENITENMILIGGGSMQIIKRGFSNVHMAFNNSTERTNFWTGVVFNPTISDERLERALVGGELLAVETHVFGTRLHNLAHAHRARDGIVVVGHFILFLFYVEENKFVARLFKLGSDNMLEVADANSKAAQCRRNIDVVECTAHGVFAANGRQFKTYLCVVSTKESSEWLTPTIWVIAKFLEIFLECESYSACIAASSCDFCHRAQYGIYSAVEWAPASLVGIHAV